MFVLKLQIMKIAKIITMLFFCFTYNYCAFAQKKPDLIDYFTQQKDIFVEKYKVPVSETMYRYNQFLKKKIDNRKTELVFAITDTSVALAGNICISNAFFTLNDTIVSAVISKNHDSQPFDILTLAIFERREGVWHLRQSCPIAKRVASNAYNFNAELLKENVVRIYFGGGRPDEVVILHPNNTVERYLKSPRRDLEFMFPSKH
jgi:hypothetical protein